MFYRQCTFKQENKTQVAWIEERGAKVGARIKFKDEDSDTGLWEVTFVADIRMPEAEAKAFERLYLKHRQFSDI